MAKVMISVPDDLLQQVDAAAEEAGETRSRFVRDALRARLAAGGATVEGRRAAAARLRTALSSAGVAGPTDSVADVRSERSGH
jgi:metal-responsive CopG/Arc/MetJ family transcriptional regulator